MYKENMFESQVVLVTGGRSGIGYGIAKRFIELGASVIICSRNEEKLRQAEASLSEKGPCIAQVCDIRDTEQLSELGDLIEKEFGKLDILINNAGGQFPSLAENISENGWKAVINNNLNGTFYTTKEMAKRFFIPSEKGVVVNIIASIIRGMPGMAHTAAARAGVEALCKTLAQEWSRFNIRVNCIAPGIIDSSGLGEYNPMVQALLDTARNEILMKRLGTVDDVVNATCFLASPLSSYISGISLYVDGTEHLHGNRMSLVELFKNIS